MKCELWHESDDECESYAMFPENNAGARKLLEPCAKLIAVFEAKTWNDAKRQQHELLGWGPFKPSADGDVLLDDSFGIDRSASCRASPSWGRRGRQGPALVNVKEKLAAAVALLIEFRDKKRYREPDSDFHEYCKGCGRSPYNQPPHAPDCIVPRLLAFLRDQP